MVWYGTDETIAMTNSLQGRVGRLQSGNNSTSAGTGQHEKTSC